MDIDKFKNQSKEIQINYANMQYSLQKVLNTNFSKKLVRIKLYNNIFLLENEYSFSKSNERVPILNTKNYNTYYEIFHDIFYYCVNEPNGMKLYDESKYKLSKLIKDDVNVKKILESHDNIQKSDLYNLYNELMKPNTNINCKKMGNTLKSMVSYTLPVKFALYIKIIAKFLNPDIEESKIRDENLPFLTILDLDNSLSEKDKKIVLNLIKLSLIIKFKGDGNIYNTTFYKQNENYIKSISIQDKIINLYEKLKNLLIELDLDKYGNLLGYIFAYSKYNFLHSLIGELNFVDNKKIFEDYINFNDNIYDKDFDINSLNKLKRYIKPIIFNIDFIDHEEMSKNIDDFFKKIIDKNNNIFITILDTKNLDERKKLIMTLLNLNNLEISDNIKTYNKVVNISTKQETDLKTLFHKSEIEDRCPKIINTYSSVLNISKQYYENAINTTSYVPYFVSYPINIDNQGDEIGFTTGPTKQIMYNLSNLLNYIIRFDEKNNKIDFVNPIWIDDKKKFYTFLTHYILTDLNIEISKINFYLNFKMIIPIFINLYDKNPNLFKVRVLFLDIIKKFNKFLNISNVKDLFFENDKPKYDNIPEDYLKFYNKICLFLIADLIDGGNEYKLLKDEETRNFILDPDVEFLETKLESYKMPDGFLDYYSFNLYYSKYSMGEIYSLMQDKLFKIYFIINDIKNLTSENLISKIIFTNNSGDEKYDILQSYLESIITDYSKDLPDDLVKEIKIKYPTQESFNTKLLLAWTASVNLTDKTELKFIITSEYGQLLRIYTCFNTIYYPSPREIDNDIKINYEEFVINLLESIDNIGFGIGGGKKTKKNKSKYKYIKKSKKVKK